MGPRLDILSDNWTAGTLKVSLLTLTIAPPIVARRRSNPQQHDEEARVLPRSHKGFLLSSFTAPLPSFVYGPDANHWPTETGWLVWGGREIMGRWTSWGWSPPNLYGMRPAGWTRRWRRLALLPLKLETDFSCIQRSWSWVNFWSIYRSFWWLGIDT